MSEIRRKPEIDYYKVLQVDTEAEPEVVEAAYRALSKKYHPDVNQSPESQNKMAQINTAYDVLGDASKRRDYNLLRESVNRYVKPPASTNNSYSAGNNVTTNTGYNRSSSASNFGNPPTNTGYRPNTPPRPTNSTSSAASGSMGNSRVGNPSTSTGRTTSTSSTSSTSNTSSTSPKRPQNPYTRPTATPGSTRAEAQERAKHGTRAGHYVYDKPHNIPFGRVVIVVCAVIVAIVVVTLLLEVFLGNPLSTHFITSPNATPTSAIVAIPTDNAADTAASLPSPTIASTVSTPTNAPISNQLTSGNVLAFLQSSNMFAGRIKSGDVSLDSSGGAQVRLQVGDKGGGTNDDVATATAAQSTTPNDPLADLHASEKTIYSASYALYRQFPDLKQIFYGLTDANGNIIYRANISQSAAFGFYSWQNVNPTNTAVADLVKDAKFDRLALHFGATQENTVHNMLSNPTDAAINAEIADWSIGPTTVTSQVNSVTNSKLVIVSYLLNSNPDKTQSDFMTILYALYTRFPYIDRVEVTSGVAGQRATYEVFCNREEFNRVGVDSWTQAIAGSNVQTLYSSLPKSEAALVGPSPIGSPLSAKQTLPVGTWETTVINAQTINSVPAYNPDGNYTLWAITVNLRNTGNQSLYPLPDELFSLTDGRGNFYQPDSMGGVQYSIINNKALLYPLAPNQLGELTLIFAVPRSASSQNLSLQVRDQSIKRTVLIK